MLLAAISSNEIAEKYQLLIHTEAELFSDDENSPDDIAEIQAAHHDYKIGDRTIFDRCVAKRETEKAPTL
ncbi:hypothetical protein [Chamaesiphon sp. GL140_3_metabinner_50]|uniref:hypothetical protein n=1 Tax=Chamaesiphon sp. GL140_3_metabinner_50 TaxID=2970812 RepID=UPI0025EFE52B|nr:hypothetical protein [Chamaesiphon sp. GL140_3_metabinner_50]